jgi:hypothetical protein
VLQAPLVEHQRRRYQRQKTQQHAAEEVPHHNRSICYSPLMVRRFDSDNCSKLHTCEKFKNNPIARRFLNASPQKGLLDPAKKRAGEARSRASHRPQGIASNGARQRDSLTVGDAGYRRLVDLPQRSRDVSCHLSPVATRQCAVGTWSRTNDRLNRRCRSGSQTDRCCHPSVGSRG